MARTVYGKRRVTDSSLGEGGQAHTFLVSDLQNPGSVFVLKRLKNLKRIDRFEREIKIVRDKQP